LNKQISLKELEYNFNAIEQNTFFEQKNSKIQSLNTNLLNAVDEQYRTSLRNSYVAKYAMKWLRTTRQRRAERESAKFLQQE